MDIEYDESKARSNLKKHRVSFREAETAMFDPFALCQEDPGSRDENRWVLLGMSDRARLLTIVYTMRAERIRIISARKATKSESKYYA